eukprot:c30981_g1_i1 orf=39-332(+)
MMASARKVKKEVITLREPDLVDINHLCNCINLFGASTKQRLNEMKEKATTMEHDMQLLEAQLMITSPAYIQQAHNLTIPNYEHPPSFVSELLPHWFL